MADEPIGEPKPPMPLPQPMARRMGRARRLFVMSFSPTKWSMATAMGQKMAATTTFGRKTESRVEARNQTKIWFFIEVPMQQSVLTEILRSSPVVVHVRQMRSEQDGDLGEVLAEHVAFGDQIKEGINQNGDEGGDVNGNGAQDPP